jgi:hypothetical protein
MPAKNLPTFHRNLEVHSENQLTSIRTKKGHRRSSTTNTIYVHPAQAIKNKNTGRVKVIYFLNHFVTETRKNVTRQVIFL